MSNPFAIATVTSAFAAMLEEVVEEQTLDPTFVTSDPPDKIRVAGTDKNRQLNLFLYQVTPNPAVENSDLPFRDETGETIARPELAIDLHYLLTAYGLNDDEVDAHHVLGHAMSVVHDTGFIPREVITQVVDATNSAVATSDLADEVHVVRLAPARMSDEDLFRLWSAFGDTKYRISVCYVASVVLIARPKSFRKAPPVLRAGGTALTMRPPRIDAVAPDPATAGDTLVLTGRDLDADEVTVRIDGINYTPDPADISAGEISLALPAALPAGPHVVQVVHAALLNEIDDTRRSFASAPALFTLAPQVENASPITTTRAAGLTIDVAPRVLRDQRAVALIGQTAVERLVDPADDAPHTTTLEFPIPEAVPIGEELPLRLEVDGVESQLTRNTTPGPDFGLPTAPLVEVTA